MHFLPTILKKRQLPAILELTVSLTDLQPAFPVDPMAVLKWGPREKASAAMMVCTII